MACLNRRVNNNINEGWAPLNELTTAAANAIVGKVIVVMRNLWAYPFNPDPSPDFATEGPIKIDNIAWGERVSRERPIDAEH